MSAPKQSRWSMPVDDPVRIRITVENPKAWALARVQDRVHCMQTGLDKPYPTMESWKTEYDFMIGAPDTGDFYGDDGMRRVVKKIMAKHFGDHLIVTNHAIVCLDGKEIVESVDVSASVKETAK